MCLCKACHKAKTAKEDVPRIRKADRQRRASVGAVRDKHATPARAKPPKVVKDKLPLPERRGIYVWEE
jgi:hypothetical protein